MVITPQILNATVVHKRLFPKENAFRYGVYYLALPLPVPPLPGWLVSFCAKDIGQRDGSDPTPWVRNILANYGLDQASKHILLVTMPRVMGYVFNPVSFYFCLDNHQNLKAVLCEVHNTFGEQHCYLCANPDLSTIGPDQWLVADKVFHVSPFLPRDGGYQFRFDLRPDKLGVWIDYYHADGRKQLVTSLMGTFAPLTPASIRTAFWRYPLVTVKAITLIHWQAVKLLVKGIRHIRKPPPLLPKITTTKNLNKM